ncbi:MAG: BatD family protein [Sulfurimonas sp.]|jgi:hypothetical protein
MKNLGKIVGKIVFALFLFPHAIMAGVVASVDSKSVELGEMVVYSLDITGSNMQLPSINSLCGSDIISSGTSTSIRGVNGVYKKSNIVSYSFVPQKSCEIEPVSVVVDGQTEKTEPINIEVKPLSQVNDLDFILSLESDKKDVFIGEAFEITLLFKHRHDAEAIDNKFVPPDFKGLWVKEEMKPIRYDDGAYTVTKVVYKVAAQREGNLTIKNAQMNIASRSNTKDSWGAWVQKIKWKSYFSQELNITAKPLPQGVNLIGDFTLSVYADKGEINANEAVNITVEVAGNGNIEDIKSFKPSIDKVSVFDEKIAIENQKLYQKMAFVSDENFVIPSFELRFFDLKTKEIKTVTTKEIPIKVKNAKPKEELNIKREEVIAPVESKYTFQEFSLYWSIAGFTVGLACGILIALVKPWRFTRRKKTVSIKEPKELLMKLMPHKNDVAVQDLIDVLEKNIYSNEKIKIDKKVLNEILKKYSIS